MRKILLGLMLYTACSVVVAEKNNNLGGSPELYRVAKGATIELTEPFYAGSNTVTFKKGQKAGWFLVGVVDPKCQLVFKGTPNAEVKEGRYLVVKAGYDEFDQGDSQFTAITTLTLETISGQAAIKIECEQSGYYNEDNAGPITVQSFKHTVGHFLDITFVGE